MAVVLILLESLSDNVESGQKRSFRTRAKNSPHSSIYFLKSENQYALHISNFSPNLKKEINSYKYLKTKVDLTDILDSSRFDAINIH